jgi:hypothetical protein
MFHKWRPVYVYRTIKPTRGIAPRDVWDAVITGERWIIPPATLEKVATIEAAVVRLANVHLVRRINATLAEGREFNATVRLRLCQFAVYTKVLPSLDSEQQFLRIALSKFNIDNPMDFIKCAE